MKTASAPRTRRRPAPLPDRPIWLDGRLVPAGEATLSLFDRGARDGEGLFETLRIYAGRPFLWERHLERLVVSAGELGFPVPPGPAELRAALEQLLDACALRDAAARITVTRGVPGGRPGRCGAWLEAEPIEGRLWHGTRRGAARAVISTVPFEPGPIGCHKTTSRLAYHLAREEARQARADEALLAAADGELLEGAVSNLFVVRDGRLATPPLRRGILPGITRAWVFRAAPRLGMSVEEARLTRASVLDAAESFLTNSLQEIVPLAELDGRPLARGNAAAGLLAAYREAAAAT
jgi:branched-chain amino acid aminotransferase